ncbi:MAG: polysaccharide deacetylase family protein [Bacillota bacterium]
MRTRRLLTILVLVAVIGVFLGLATGYVYRWRAPEDKKGAPAPGGPGPTAPDPNGPNRPPPGPDQPIPPQVNPGPPVPVIDQLAGAAGGTGAGGASTGAGSTGAAGSAKGATKSIALTFDAGWVYDTTGELLDILDREGVRATFFLRAKWVEDHPDLARAIAARGHLVGDHSFSHQDMTRLTLEAREAELTRSEAVFQSVLGRKPTLFRPPYGAYDRVLLGELNSHGYRAAVMWTIDSLDWEEPGADKVGAKVLKNARDGAIVLMHIGSHDGLKALPAIIEGLRRDGYRFVRLDAIGG